MGDAGTPWSGDATSLVDAFRAGERSPLEELGASLAAVAASELNAVCFVDDEAARDAARSADVSLARRAGRPAAAPRPWPAAW